MKNIKNTVAAMSLMAVLGFSAVTANAGLMLSDRNASPTQPTCEVSVFDQLTGIIIVGLTGIMLGDVKATCTEAPSQGLSDDGIIIVGK